MPKWLSKLLTVIAGRPRPRLCPWCAGPGLERGFRVCRLCGRRVAE